MQKKPQKPQATKNKSNKLDFIKMKNFCSSEDIVKKVKMQATAWEKIFERQLSDKEHVSKLYK